MSSAARSFDQRSAAAVAQLAAELDAVPDGVSPSSASMADAGGLDFRAAQIAEDAKLAEELQREEYRIQEARAERRRQRQEAERNASWTDWLMGTTTTPSSTAASPTNASATSSSSSPYASRTASSSGGRGGARVAQPSNSIFACVAQSVSSVMGPPPSEVSGVDSTSLL